MLAAIDLEKVSIVSIKGMRYRLTQDSAVSCTTTHLVAKGK